MADINIAYNTTVQEQQSQITYLQEVIKILRQDKQIIDKQELRISTKLIDLYEKNNSLKNQNNTLSKHMDKLKEQNENLNRDIKTYKFGRQQLENEIQFRKAESAYLDIDNHDVDEEWYDFIENFLDNVEGTDVNIDDYKEWKGYKSEEE